MSDYKMEYDCKNGGFLDIKSHRPFSVTMSIMRDLEIAVTTMHTALPIQKCEIKTLSVSPLRYEYRIDLVDGRVWLQFLDFVAFDDTDPKQEFDVSDGWKLTEYTLQRSIREALIGLVNAIHLETCEITW